MYMYSTSLASASSDNQQKEGRSSKTKNKKYDDFIIKHYRQNKAKKTSNADIEELNEGRIVFVGTCAIFKCWQDISSATLYTSLLLLPLKRKWIYQPNKYRRELQEKIPLAKGIYMRRILCC